MLYIAAAGLILSVSIFGFKRGVKFFVTMSAIILVIMWTWKFLLVLFLIGLFFIIKFVSKIKVYKSSDFEGFRNSYNRNYSDYGNYGGFGGFENYNNSGRISEWYKELEVNEDISDEELKKSHKKLVRMYHPDMHHDKSESERKVYEDKFKKINEAYENIKKHRGL